MCRKHQEKPARALESASLVAQDRAFLEFWVIPPLGGRPKQGELVEENVASLVLGINALAQRGFSQ